MPMNLCGPVPARMAQAFPLAQVCQDVVGEMLLRFHVHLIAAILALAPRRRRNFILVSDYDSKGRA
jgi:hypothetical protein